MRWPLALALVLLLPGCAVTSSHPSNSTGCTNIVNGRDVGCGPTVVLVDADYAVGPTGDARLAFHLEKPATSAILEVSWTSSTPKIGGIDCASGNAGVVQVGGGSASTSYSCQAIAAGDGALTLSSSTPTSGHVKLTARLAT